MDHQPDPGTAGTVTNDRQPADKAGSARDNERAPEPAAITWTRAQLRERIQRAGPTLVPAAQSAGRPTREMDRSPPADTEAEP
jgi:hypothetical protein